MTLLQQNQAPQDVTPPSGMPAALYEETAL